MAKETKSLGRKENLDKFYTKKEIAKQCIDFLDFSKYDYIIEPSAGNGSFSSQIPDCIAYDIFPDSEGIIQQDWLSYNNTLDGKILVVGNPPFGEQNSLSVKFFNKSAEFAQTIAFIVPLSFKKKTLQNRLDLNFSLKFELSIDKNSFLLNGENYSVPCCFQVWERGARRTKEKFKMETNLFTFTKDRELADFRIQRVGGNAGKAFLNKNASLASNYYIINNSDLNNADFMQLINSISFPSIDYTVGPKSLSKGELIYEVEKVLKETSN